MKASAELDDRRIGGWFLVLLLAWPSVDYFIYYAITCIVIFSIVVEAPPTRSQILLWTISLLFISAISAPKLIIFNSASDLKELAKSTLFLTLCLLFSANVSQTTIARALLLTLALDLIFTILQWIQFDGLGFNQINTYLHPQHHIEGSLLLSSVRALGIFADTAEHAAIGLIAYCYFLANLRHRLMRRISSLGAVISATVLVLTQSKTGFIAFLVLLPITYYCFAQSFSKSALNMFVALAAVGLYQYIPELGVDNVEQYYRLFEFGLSVSSFDERQAIWKSIIDISFDSNPALLLFGAGRGALELRGLQSSVFDNDIIYLLNGYGIIGLMIVAFLYIYIILRLSRMNTAASTWLLYTLLLTPLVGFATDFISSLKVLVLLGIAGSLTFNEYKKSAVA